MSDIDFDELDKAVNSLMSQNESEQPQLSETQNPDATIGSVSSPASAPVTETAVRPTPSTPAVNRTPGRFMDIVAPSPSRRPVRPAPVVRQETPLPTEPLPVTESVSSVSADASSEVDASSELALVSGDTPVDASQGVTTAEDGNSDLTRPELDDLKDISSTMDSIVSELQDSPMQSPFLSDVAVDKRPLGAVDGAFQEDIKDDEAVLGSPSPVLSDGFALENSVQDVEQNEIISPINSDQSATEATTETEIPPEMSAEVLALESAETITPEAVAVVDGGGGDKAPVAIGTPPVAIAGEAPANAMAAGDIKPQYTPSEVDTPEPSAIFDTAVDLPQPLQHQEKKKSGWMVVVWIVLLIVIGVAGGVAAWFFLLK